MRIISGKFKGRRLVEFKAAHIRPTTDRVKETIFNILQHDLVDSRVLDLFSGTGNLAIESLSRGAGFVTAVESHRGSLKIIRENLQLLKIDRDIKVIAQDVFKFLQTFNGEPFQVVFIDPPFTESLAHSCMEAISRSSVLGPHSLVVIEASRHERLDDKYSQLELLDRRDFGDKSASIFRKAQI